MLLDLLTLCTVPIGLFCLAYLPWSDADIAKADNEIRKLSAYTRAQIRRL